MKKTKVYIEYVQNIMLLFAANAFALIVLNVNHRRLRDTMHDVLTFQNNGLLFFLIAFFVIQGVILATRVTNVRRAIITVVFSYLPIVVFLFFVALWDVLGNDIVDLLNQLVVLSAYMTIHIPALLFSYFMMREISKDKNTHDGVANSVLFFRNFRKHLLDWRYNLILCTIVGIIAVILTYTYLQFYIFTAKTNLTSAQANLDYVQEELDQYSHIYRLDEESTPLDDRWYRVLLADSRGHGDKRIYRMQKNNSLVELANIEVTSEEDYVTVELLKDRPGFLYGSRNLDNQREYRAINVEGRDITQEVEYIQNVSLPITNAIKRKYEEGYVYTPSVAQEEENNIIYTVKNDGTIHSFSSDLLPTGLDSTRIAGWSKATDYLYMTKLGWEGYDYANLWRASLKEEHVEAIVGADELPLSNLSIVPKRDIAIGIQASEGSCEYCMSGIVLEGPSELRVFDLVENKYAVIHYSDQLLSHAVLSPSGEYAFFTLDLDGDEYDLYRIDTDGSGLQKIAENSTIVGMSYDGITLTLKTGSYDAPAYYQLDTARDVKTSLELQPSVSFLQCPYPLGFSCLYTD